MTNLREWLVSLRLESYYERFVEQRVDLDVLSDLTEVDLASLGLLLGDRKRMMRGIKALQHYGVPAPSSAAGSADKTDSDSGWLSPSLIYDHEERRQLTLLFADLVGSTQLSKTLDLESYRDAIRSYQICCSNLVRAHFGFVAQFQGDGVVAYFGYPAAEEDDAERAVSTGLAIVREIGRLKLPDHKSLAARVGIATGDVLVSDLVGDRLAMKAAVVGDTPNLAARLQAVARPGQVIVSDNTHRLLGSQFNTQLLGEQEIKGFEQPQRVWVIHGVRASPSRFAARSRGPMTPLVGREEEREILLHRWSMARDGEGQVVLISGEAGIGKSRLGEWLHDAIPDQLPRHRVSFQCSHYHTGSPFHPIMVQVARAAGFEESDDADERLDKLEILLAQGTRDVASLAPLFARLYSIPFEHRYGPINQTPEVIKERTVAALLDQLFGLAARQPVLVCFEDLHWVDPSTEELLDLLVNRIGESRVLLVCTFRPEYETPWLGRAGVTHLSLSRLDRKRSIDLVTRVASDEELPRDLLEQIVARTEGVPLFLEELTRAVIEHRRIPEGSTATEPLLPASLKELLMAKLDRLSSARDVVPLCAAIGRSFSYRLLLAISELSEKEIRPVLDELTQSQILLHRGEYPNVTYTFRHALIQEAAYETMLESRARALHARIADVLKTHFGEAVDAQPEVLAQHLARAGRAVEAREQWRAAAALATKRSANIEACAHLNQALAENAKLAESPERTAAEIVLRETMREPIDLCGWGSEEIERNLRRLYELRKEQGDTDELFSVIFTTCGTHLLAGRIRAAEDDANRMVALAERTREPVHDILAVHTRAFLAFLAGRFPEAIAAFDRELAALHPECASRLHHHYVAEPAIVARVMQAWALTLSGERHRAEARIAEAERLITTEEQTFSRVYGQTIIASIRQTCGEAEAACELATTAWLMAHEERVPYWEAWAAVVRGWAMTATGEIEDGLATLREGLKAYSRTGARQMLPYGRTLLADALLRAGRIQEGLSVVEQIQKDETTNEVRFFDAERSRVADALRRACGL